MMIICEGYSAEYYPQSNQIVITMPQTVKTITNTVQMVTNRKIDITDDDLVELLSALWSINERSRGMSGEVMEFPKTAEEFMEKYKIIDSEQVYTNGAELVPIFRMKQWFEHLECENCQKKPKNCGAIMEEFTNEANL